MRLNPSSNHMLNHLDDVGLRSSNQLKTLQTLSYTKYSVVITCSISDNRVTGVAISAAQLLASQGN